MRPLAFLRPPVLVMGSAPLADQVVAGLGRDGCLARRIDRVQLAMLKPGRTPLLILADPPGAPDLIAELIERSRKGPQGRRRPPQRLILMHPREPAPALPILEPADPWRIDTFAIRDRAARALLARWPLHLGMDPRFGQAPHLLIIGFDDPAEALMLQALRLIHLGQGSPRITLLCDDNEAIAAKFLAAYPQAPLIADLQFAPIADLSRILNDSRRGGAPGDPARQRPINPGAATPVTFAAVCVTDPGTGDGSPGLELARRLVHELAVIQGVSPPILLETGEAVPGGQVEDWDGQIIPVAYLREACRAPVLLEGSGDEIARTIHDHYRDTIAAQGRDPDGEPAGQPWETLANSYRQANRHQADHVWAKLAVSDCRAVPEDLVESFVMSPLQVEQLALIEHQRWAADRHLDGWRYGPVRDNRLKHHPQLIPYADLSEAMKDLDRFGVRGLPTLAARLGLGIQRLLILGVHQPGPTCPDGSSLRRVVDRLLARLVERYPDRALVLAATLTDPRERQVVARALESEAGVGLFLLLPRPLSLILADLPDREARRDFLTLAARAERRINLDDEAQLVTWFAQRAEISLILGDPIPLGAAHKQVRLDPGGRSLAWTFEY